MKMAWMLVLMMLLGATPSFGGDVSHSEDHDVESKSHSTVGEKPAVEGTGKVLAVDAKTAKAIREKEVVIADGKVRSLVDRSNVRIDLAPHAAVEFSEEHGLRLLRGSAYVSSNSQQLVRTSSAQVDYVGSVLLSYDHKLRSTSVFVLDGEARVVNPHETSSTLRLDRFRGATLQVGEVVPQLVRQLDVGSIDSWMQGYGWPAGNRKEILHDIPDQALALETKIEPHLKQTKLEDYFSSIDTADEFSQPDYYRRKFEDPDKVIAEANSKKGSGKSLSPEEAALVSLPSVKIDLGFDLGPEFVTDVQKRKELRALEARETQKRSLASIEAPKKQHAPAAEAKKKPMHEDPDIAAVLERLKAVKNSAAEVRKENQRAPASLGSSTSGQSSVVPDPVYDFSQNF